MTEEHRERAEMVFLEATQRPVTERTDFAEQACAGEPEVLREVLSLLESAEDAEEFLAALAAGAGAPSGSERQDAGPRLEGERIGSYRLVRELGRGGIGTVYLAEREDGDFEQRVAIKLLRRGLDTDDILARFRAERQILASLNHPNIARLLDGGATEDGRPYLTMELVEGLPITEYCDRRRCTIEERLRLFVTAAHAVQHAHEKLIVHRDLKPSNILVTEDGTPKLLDFGIAKLLDDSLVPGISPRTRTGVQLMTPEYASPEQLRGEPVSTASDVYQLGVLLYQLLAGRRPVSHEYDAASARTGDFGAWEPLPPSAALRPMRGRHGPGVEEEIPERVAARRATDVRALRRRLRKGLDGVVLQALRSEPAERYPSVAVLTEDVERYLSGASVTGRAESRTRQVWRSVIRQRVGPMAAVLVLLAVMGGAIVGNRASVQKVEAVLPLLAIGEVANHAGAETAELAGSLGGLLTAGLSQTRVPLLGSWRVHEVLAQMEAGGEATSMSAAARAAGAAELVQGAIHRRSDGGLRLQVQLVDLARGGVRSTFTVEADDAQKLAELAVTRIASELGVPLPPNWWDKAVVSPTAYRFYEEGLRAYYRGDDAAARGYFTVAVREDSTFALPSYYLSLTTVGEVIQAAHLNRALRHSGRSSEAERLLIRTVWAEYMFEPEFLLLADSLVRRLPADPEGHLLLGNALILRGEYLRAVSQFQRAIELDSLSFRAAPARCRGCDALHRTIHAYAQLDSLAAAEREARRWVELQPRSARSWAVLSSVLLWTGQFDEALASRQRAAELREADVADAVFPGVVALFAGDFARADRLLREKAQFSPPAVRRRALLWQVTSLRNQGRLREALGAAREYRALTGPDYAAWSARAPEALVLFESGRLRAAMAAYDSLARDRWNDEGSANRLAGHHAWVLMHLANARAVAGDTLGLEALADSVEALGRRSGNTRFRLSHHHARGMLALARSDREAAVKHFSLAISASMNRNGQSKVELARTLLDLQRPEEALRVLQPVTRASMVGPINSAVRTDVHELLGQAWEATGRPDSAAVYYRRVLHAWQRADPEWHGRRSEVQRRLDALGQPEIQAAGL